jgi:hypothetical protein
MSIPQCVMTKQEFEQMKREGKVVLVRRPGESLGELLDDVRVEHLRCPRNVPVDEWLAYFKERLGDSGRRLEDIV